MGRTLPLFLVAALLVVQFTAAPTRAAYAFTTLNDPLGPFTYANGIWGNTVVGTYFDGTGVPHGFIFDGSNYSSFDAPPGPPDAGTYARAISGNIIVGVSANTAASTFHGYRYDGSNFTSIDSPMAGSGGTLALGIGGTGGNIIVGEYKDASDNVHGFRYDGSNYATVDDPLATDGTYVAGISSGNVIVGGYGDALKGHGFLYDGSTLTTIDDPLGVNTNPMAIFANTVVGYYTDSANHDHGFVYDGSTFMTVDDPAGTRTRIRGIWGTTLVGDFLDNTGTHGFIATVPEPRGLALACVGGLLLLRRVNKREGKGLAELTTGN